MLAHLGIGIEVDNKPIVSIHGILIPLEEEVEKRLTEILRPHNADVILGLVSMDELHITIEEKTHRPKPLPIIILKNIT